MTAIERAPVWLGTAATVPLVAGRDLVVTLPRNWRNKTCGQDQLRCADPGAGGEGGAVGKLVVTGQGVPGMVVPLIAGADVPMLGLPGRAMAVLSHYVTGG